MYAVLDLLGIACCRIGILNDPPCIGTSSQFAYLFYSIINFFICIYISNTCEVYSRSHTITNLDMYIHKELLFTIVQYTIIINQNHSTLLAHYNSVRHSP